MSTDSGLTATELAQAIAELAPQLTGTSVRDLACLVGNDDLLLFLDGAQQRYALHIAPGGQRARLTCTQRRFKREQMQTGPLIDRLGQSLRGARITAIHAIAGERSCTVCLQQGGAEWQLQIELFGARGLWCLVAPDGCIRELSRLPNSKGRELRPGAPYRPPAQRTTPIEDPPSRFVAPVLAAIDQLFSARDQAQERTLLQSRLRQALDRSLRKLRHKLAGLQRQKTELGRVQELRTHADMLLAYGFGAARGATSITVPDPADPDAELTLALIPGKPIQVQAEKLYQRARKLEDGATMAAQRRQQAASELAELESLDPQVDAAHAEGIDALQELRAEFRRRGLIREARQLVTAAPTPRSNPLHKLTKGHNVRCFNSAEGHLIMVGRSNQQNDRLSMSIARGNDYWLHVGRGYAGSHVVVRLPRDKTPSLETLLDAGTLAIHFSKARNADRCEVIYTQAKHVRKPKGLPPGKVTTTDTKTLQIDMEPARLRRLLDSAAQ